MSIIVRSNDSANPVQTFDHAGKAVVAESKEHESAPEPKASEQKEITSESETEEAEEDGASEESDAGRESETEDQTEAKDKPKKKGGFQRRIDKLNAAKSAAQQEADYWKREALKYQGATEPKKEPQADVTKPASVEGKPSPDGYDTHAEYVEALTDWKTEQKFKEREQKAEKDRLIAEQASVAKSYTERAQAFAKEHPDFDEVIADADGVPVSSTVRGLILESDNGPALAYELAKNPEELERISKLGPMATAREIGKIEARLAAQSSDPKTETKKITKAPNPLAPVGAGGKGSTPKLITDPNLSQAEYERLRMEQIKKRRQA